MVQKRGGKQIQRGGTDKQPGKGGASRGKTVRRIVKLTPKDKETLKKNRKIIRAADMAASHSTGSEYEPSRDITSESIPDHMSIEVPVPEASSSEDASMATSKKAVNVVSSSFDEFGTDDEEEGQYSTSLIASISGESAGYAKGGEPNVGGIDRTRKPEAWEDRFISEVSFHRYREWWKKRKLIPERRFIDADLFPHNPHVQAQFRTREGWGFFKEKVDNANEHMVKEFYSNVHHVVQDTKATKVREKTVVFDGQSLNDFLGFGE